MSDDFRSPYSDYDVLEKWSSPSWNDVTRAVVARRLHGVPRRRFFTASEWHTLEAVCARLIPQPDRRDDPVPIVPWIDDRLHRGRGRGYRYASMPPARDAWRLGVRAIDDEARRRFARPFVELDAGGQDHVLRAVQHGEVEGDVWKRLPPTRFFRSTLLETVVGIYYAHPAAWSEIGYGGPASPRGYVRLGFDQRDAWEAEERGDPAQRESSTGAHGAAE